MKAFISHSSIDKPFVERLATDLRTREGIDAWYDAWEILPGDRIPDKLEEGLANAGILVLVLSPDSVNSQPNCIRIKHQISAKLSRHLP
ncbi:toll/interleukin-1 receptor domain-containing protein [Coleofasciculus sp.]|uniref:toll/interleukin-1 receptor domain-containing protein n=1 Tax=Coleofasciculus sp. TaxID=3100458 RepID=UPI0039F878DC